MDTGLSSCLALKYSAENMQTAQACQRALAVGAEPAALQLWVADPQGDPRGVLVLVEEQRLGSGCVLTAS